ncbi:hypothetical protein IY145_11445 [Methylosinus sp. H3A]|uniref:hypothetical protein n=1 Tax=Methylosinus sp. H3A TaxID=2785786 RepID=UPI0018C28C79|nr:hypothetical protein [Methylosinus sp. H3A]MBG0809993.1 hypothetical protein [Methylosinus sp. H3A]
MELTQWLNRFTDTTDSLREALDNSGAKEASICAVVACMSAADREELAADLHAISVFFPALLRTETSYITRIAIDVSSIALFGMRDMTKSIDDSCAALDEQRITLAWQNSVWRKLETA